MILPVQDRAPNFVHLLELLLSLPATSVECERVFLLMKIIKIDWRSRIKNDMLRHLLRISVESKAVGEFDQQGAIQIWKARVKHTRKPTTMPYGK